MKPKYFLALGLLALGLGSCGESFFEQYPSNNITEGNFYKTDDDFNQGVVACYAKLKTQMSFHLTEIGYRSDENVLESMAVSTQDRYDIDHFAETAQQRHPERHLGCVVQRHLPLQRRARPHGRSQDPQLRQIPRRMPVPAVVVVFQPLPGLRRGARHPHRDSPGGRQTHSPLHGGGDVHAADRRPRRSGPAAAFDTGSGKGPRGEHRGLHAAGEGLPHVRQARRGQDGPRRGDEEHLLRAGDRRRNGFSTWATR